MLLMTPGAMKRRVESRRQSPRGGWMRIFSGAMIACLVLALGAAIAVRPASAQQGFPSVGDELVVNTDALNFRDGPGTDSTVIDVLYSGTMVLFMGLPASGSNDGHDWYQVETSDGTTGWVAGEYLAPPDSASGFPIGAIVQVATDELNVRDNAGLDSNVIDVIPNGTISRVEGEPVSADGYTWYWVNVRGEGEYGWVAGELLTEISQGSDIAVGDPVMVATDALNIRDGAGLDANILDTLTYGFTASVIDGPISADGYTWFEIQTSAITGWVAGEYLLTQ